MLFFQILTLHLGMKQRGLRRRIFLCAFSKRLKQRLPPYSTATAEETPVN